MLLGGDGTVHLGCAFSELPELPPLQESPHSLAMEAASEDGDYTFHKTLQ